MNSPSLEMSNSIFYLKFKIYQGRRKSAKAIKHDIAINYKYITRLENKKPKRGKLEIQTMRFKKSALKTGEFSYFS